MKLKQAQEMFKSTVDIWEEGQQGKGLGYDPETMSNLETLVHPRVAYMNELLRQVAHVSKRVVAVVDEALMPHLEDRWVKLTR